ncbi:MAG: zinc transport system substrate-binding protein [Actinomycetota bacterium]|jgi:zinc transport system substrate-binding protein
MRRTALLTLVALTALVACGDSGGGDASGGRLEVVASFYPVAQAATQVGGDLVQVRNLTPAGTEPHDVELSPRQVDQLEGADVVLYIGQGFQPAVETLAERRDNGAVDLLDGITLEKGAADALHAEEGGEEAGAEPGHEEEAVDPHFWLDPQRMITAVDEVADALAGASPKDAATFRSNAARYRAELTQLDGELERGLASCTRREIVTSHAAFFYLAERYGLTQLAIAGLSPEAEPDPERLASLSDTIESKGITTVFYEDLVSPEVANTLARETGATTAVLSPIEGLTKDQLDEGKTYVTVMRDNLAALRKALDCP